MRDHIVMWAKVLSMNFKKEFEIEDEWIPFELHPEVPIEGKKVSEFFQGMLVGNMFNNLNNTSNKYGIKLAELI